MLDPTTTPETNLRFLLFLVATLDGLYKHGGLLRAAIASASNEHRLGAQEAPPGIISAFLGDHLTEVLDAVEANREVKNFSQPHLQTVKVGGTVLDLRVATLPTINRDLTDRNRTSPFAFTGNKFEFRAVGSKSSPSFPTVLINAAVSQSLHLITAALEKQMGSKPAPSVDDILTVVRQFIKSSKLIRFEGNNYSDEWKAEAERRGLPNINSCPEAFKKLIDPVHSKLLTSLGIMTETEVTSRYHILCEKYVKDVVIEANTLKGMIFQGILPAVFEHRKDICQSLASQKSLGIEIAALPEKKMLDKITPLISGLYETSEKLVSALDQINTMDEHAQAPFANSVLLSHIASVRTIVDDLEVLCPDKYWPYPKYLELLF